MSDNRLFDIEVDAPAYSTSCYTCQSVMITHIYTAYDTEDTNFYKTN